MTMMVQQNKGIKHFCKAVATWAVRLGRQSKSTAFILRMRIYATIFSYVSCIFSIFV